MATTLLELLASLPEDALQEGSVIEFVDIKGRERTLTIGPRKFEPPQMSAWAIPAPDGSRWHQHATG